MLFFEVSTSSSENFVSEDGSCLGSFVAFLLEHAIKPSSIIMLIEIAISFFMIKIILSFNVASFYV